MHSQVSTIFLNHILQLNWRDYFSLPSLIEMLSYHVHSISPSDSLNTVIFQGLQHPDLAVQKRAFFLLASKTPDFESDSKWIQFSLYYNSLYQTNKSIIEPILKNISDIDIVLQRYPVELVCVLWNRAFSNEYQLIKKLSLEYFLKIDYCNVQFSKQQSSVLCSFIMNTVLNTLDNFFLYTDYAMDNLTCEFGELVQSWFVNISPILPLDTLNLFLHELTKATTMSLLVYAFRGLNASKFDRNSILLDHQNLSALLNNRAFYSNRLKYVWFMELIDFITSFQAIAPEHEDLSPHHSRCSSLEVFFKICNCLCEMLQICKSRFETVKKFIALNVDNIQFKRDEIVRCALESNAIKFDSFRIFLDLLSIEPHSLGPLGNNLLFNLTYAEYVKGTMTEDIEALIEIVFSTSIEFEECLNIANRLSVLTPNCQAHLLNSVKSKFESIFNTINALCDINAFKMLLLISKLASPNPYFDFLSRLCSYDFTTLPMDSPWKASRFMILSLKYEIFRKNSSLLPTTATMINDLKTARPEDSILILKCLSHSTDASHSNIVYKVFPIVKELLAECQTTQQTYFAILKEFLTYAFISFEINNDASLVSDITQHFMKSKKKGVDLMLGTEFMNVVIQPNPYNIVKFQDEYVNFLVAGVFMETVEERNVEFLCTNCNDISLDVFNSSPLMNGLRLRAMFNEFLETILDFPDLAELVVRELLFRLLSKDCDCTLSMNDAYPSTPKQKLKFRLLMPLCILVGGGASKKLTDFIIESCLELLQKEFLQAVRYYIEFVIMQCIIHSANQRESFNHIYRVLQENISEKPGYLISIMSIILHTYQQIDGCNVESIISKLVCLFLNGNHTIRTFSCYLFTRMIQESGIQNPTFDSINQFIQSNEFTQKTIRKLSSVYMLSQLDPINDCNYEFIFVSMLRLGDSRCFTECIPIPLFEEAAGGKPRRIPLRKSNDSLVTGWNDAVFKEQLNENNSDSAAVPNPIIDEQKETDESSGETTTFIPSSPTNHIENLTQHSKDTLTTDSDTNTTSNWNEQLQRKIIPWEVSTMESDQAECLATKVKKVCAGEIIVVASLLEKIPNIAGLCRTCEIFGVSTLVLSSMKLTEQAAFKSQTVTADLWLNFDECPKENLLKYLHQKQAEGYELVGLEQTSKSVPLERYKCSSRTVLVLGNEKYGIPVDILNAMNRCVEIPQFGVVRSLNVHVSGSLIVWEMRKHLSLQDK